MRERSGPILINDCETTRTDIGGANAPVYVVHSLKNKTPREEEQETEVGRRENGSLRNERGIQVDVDSIILEQICRRRSTKRA